MKKKIVYFIAIATIVLIGACSNDGVMPENDPNKERTISLKASMPDDGPPTRVSLAQEGKNIILRWAVGDKIELLFKQGATEAKETVTVTSISNDGKSAQFDVEIPSEITNGSFDLYGVYGGEGLSTTYPTKAVLPENAGTATTLNDLEDYTNSVEGRKDVMLYFASRGVQTANPAATVLFKHLGSLFSITVTNIGDSDIEDFEVRLIDSGVAPSDYWAFNTDVGGEEFDLVSEEFIVNNTGDYYLSFATDQFYLNSGSSVTFWAWYPPLPNVNWPELVLAVLDAYGEWEIESSNTKPARIEPTMPGKAYYFYAELDADNELLHFTDAPSFVDTRDGNAYKIVTISDQVWMAENLKYLPSVVGPAISSETNPYYYVYGYDGTDVNAAKATANYSDYGVLYNWPAIMAGEAGSNSFPSGVQGICPEGWHVPSDTEWTMLFDHLGGQLVAGGQLKEAGTQHWYTPNTGATNESGFTALPGGFLTNNTFSNRGVNGFWYSATDFDGNRAYGPYMYNQDSEVKTNGLTKDHAFSVRCVKLNINVGM